MPLEGLSGVWDQSVVSSMLLRGLTADSWLDEFAFPVENVLNEGFGGLDDLVEIVA